MRRAYELPLFVLGLGLALACAKLTSPPAPEPIASDTPTTAASAAGTLSARPITPMHPTPSSTAAEPAGELKIDDLVTGKGPEVKSGDTVVVHYSGALTDGTKFDASRDHPQTAAGFTTPIPGRLIQGWNKGIPGMRVGGKRKLTVPPSLGYGAMPQSKIPANSTLVFEIELLEIKAANAPPPPPKGP